MVVQALAGTMVHIPTLDGSLIPLQLDIIKPNTVKRIPGMGLPFPKEPDRRGYLIVDFDIKFPESLSRETRDKLAKLLPA